MKTKIVFVIILLLASLLRFYQLGDFPSGLTWDEAAIGYNAYGIATVHRDEWLNRMPIVFRSFGDYKSPLLIYVTSLLFFITPPTTLLIRLPVAVAGIGVVIVSYLLTKEIFSRFIEYPDVEQHSIEHLSLLVMFLVAISPWAIHFSRIGFESMLAVFLVSFGTWCWLKMKRSPVFLLIGNLAFVLSLYAYHSAKIVVPLIVIVLSVRMIKDLFTQLKWVIIGSVLAAIVLLPLGYASIYGKANDRAMSTTILEHSNPIPLFISNYLKHLSPSYLLGGEDITYRHGTQKVGIYYPTELLFLFIGLITIYSVPKWRKLWWIPGIYFISIVPAALGNDVPHSNRALLGLPWSHVLAGVGIANSIEIISTHSLFRKIKIRKQMFFGGVGIVSLCFLLLFIRTYGQVYRSSTALKDFGYGYEEAVLFARDQESKVNKVYFTNVYGQAYIYLLLYKGLDPIEYRQGALANYSISDTPLQDARGQSNVLIVGTPAEIPSNIPAVKEIKYPDGEVAFRIIKQ